MSAGETAGSQHHAVLCFNSSGTAALVFNIVALQFRVEAIAFTIGHTDDSAVFVQDEIIELGTRHDLDVGELLEFIMHRNDVSGSGAGLDFIRTRNGVTPASKSILLGTNSQPQSTTILMVSLQRSAIVPSRFG